jgi:A/G-specific adenine glycosylase
MNDLQQNLLDWFDKHGRDLPWRKNYQPYHVWISEIMLQQTQMDRVVEYFSRWINKFPDVHSIANASEEEVLKLWEGLGYYSRAKNIIKTSRLLIEMHDGKLPTEYDHLLKLPGIGKYTAGAIMSIAYNREYSIVDANIERVFARLFNIDGPVKEKKAKSYIWQLSDKLIPRGKARMFNQSIMELGALVCIPKNPRCMICPVANKCESLQHGLVAERPVLAEPPKTVFIEMATGILRKNGKILIQKRKPRGVWANLWEFPGGRLEPGETPEMALIREYAEETELKVNRLEKITTVKHSYTIYRVTLHCYNCSLQGRRSKPVLHGAQEYRWVKPQELSEYAFPAGHRKLIQFLELG